MPVLPGSHRPVSLLSSVFDALRPWRSATVDLAAGEAASCRVRTNPRRGRRRWPDLPTRRWAGRGAERATGSPRPRADATPPALASVCSDATDDLRDLADQRAVIARKAQANAREQAAAREQLAQMILSTPAVLVGDDCGSARVRVDRWRVERRAEQ